MTDQDSRRDWMSLMAKAPAEDLARHWQALEETDPEFTWLRPPETGAVMVQGRTGGTGSPFNIGEMTVTRCSLRLASGEVGHAVVQGRDQRKAETAAIVDAMMQTSRAPKLRSGLLDPLRRDLGRVRAARAARAEGTKVNFFTMARGEDA